MRKSLDYLGFPIQELTTLAFGGIKASIKKI
jgi:hypothetical protein